MNIKLRLARLLAYIKRQKRTMTCIFRTIIMTKTGKQEKHDFIKLLCLDMYLFFK